MKRNLSEDFRIAAVAHGLGTREGRPEDTSAAYKLKLAVLAQLRKLPDRGQAIFESLLEDPDPAVRSAAACQLLPFNEELAISALEKVVAMGDHPLIRFGARMILTEWRAGRLKLP
jgi:hypothetical protein